MACAQSSPFEFALPMVADECGEPSLFSSSPILRLNTQLNQLNRNAIDEKLRLMAGQIWRSGG
jgi:hypothetical protein